MSTARPGAVCWFRDPSTRRPHSKIPAHSDEPGVGLAVVAAIQTVAVAGAVGRCLAPRLYRPPLGRRALRPSSSPPVLSPSAVASFGLCPSRFVVTAAHHGLLISQCSDPLTPFREWRVRVASGEGNGRHCIASKSPLRGGMRNARCFGDLIEMNGHPVNGLMPTTRAPREHGLTDTLLLQRRRNEERASPATTRPSEQRQLLRDHLTPP